MERVLGCRQPGERRKSLRQVLRNAVLLAALVPATVALGQANTWVKLPASTVGSRYYSQFYTNCGVTTSLSHAVPREFSGVVYGNGQLFYFGGGHSGHQGNDVELYDIGANTWTQQYQPECLPACCCQGACDPANGCANQPPYCTGGAPSCLPGPCRIIGGTGSYVPSPLGRPYVEHVFRDDAYNPARGKFLLVHTSGTWEFDPANGVWTLLTVNRPSSQDIQTKHVSYDPTVGMLCFATAPYSGPPAVYVFDYAAKTWNLLGDMPQQIVTDNNGEFYCAYDSKRHQHLCSHIGTSAKSLWLFDATAGAAPNGGVWTQLTNVPTELLSWPDAYHGVASLDYDSRNDVYLVGVRRPSDATFQLWTYAPGSGTWQRVSPAGGPPAGPTVGDWGVLNYDPQTARFYLVNVGEGGASGTSNIAENGLEMWSLSLDLASLPATPTPTAAAPVGAIPTVPVTSLAGHWPLDEGSGTTAHDLSGNGNDGTVNGLAWVAGHVGGALSGNGGAGQEVDIPDSPSLAASNGVSVVAWVRTSTPQTGIGGVTRGPPDAQDYDYMLYFSGGVAFFVKNASGVADSVGASAAYADGGWHQYAGTYDGQTLKLYVDGMVAASKTTTIGLPVQGKPGDMLRLLQGWSGNLNGTLDDVRIYNGALSLTHVQDLFTQDGGVIPTPTVTATPTPTLTPTATPTLAGSPTALAIPLTIQELLPADDNGGANPKDVAGHDRTQEPVTFGIPLRDADNINDPALLAVRSRSSGGMVPAQFRVLKRYPDNNVQWVLVDLQASVAANGVNTDLELVTGNNPATGVLANDDGATITIDTGPARFTVRKAMQNVIDSAVVDGVPLVAAGHGEGIVFKDAASGAMFESVNDGASTAVVAENGPLKAVIEEQGRLRDPGGTAEMGYTLRLTFYANKAFVKAQVSIENAFRDDVTRKAIGYIEVRVPLSLGGGKAFTLATKTSTVSGLLGANDDAFLFQGTTTHKFNSTAVGDPSFRSPFIEENDWNFFGSTITGSSQTGFQVQHGGQVLHAFAGSSDYSRGFGDLADGSGAGMSAAMRDFDAFFPTGIEMNSAGEVAVELFSKHNSPSLPLIFNFGSHATRDVVFDFHATAADPALTYYRAQYPLFGRAPYEQYRVTGAFLGRTMLVGQSEIAAYHDANVINGQNQWAVANQADYGYSRYTLPNQQIVRMRSYRWDEGGRQTNNDETVAKALQFLSTGYGGQFQTDYNFVHFIADQAIRHSDREDGATWSTDPWDNVTGPAGITLIGSSSSQFELDMEHENVLGVPLFYYLTGDENIKEALVDHGEWLLDHAPWSNGACGFTGTADRGISQRAKWFSVLWQFTGDSRYFAQVSAMVDSYLCSMKDLENGAYNTNGQDLSRGYWWNGSPAVVGPRTMNLGPIDVVRSESVYQLMKALPDTDPRKQELRDRLLGTAYFEAREAYFDNAGSPCHGFDSPGTPGMYQLDQAPNEGTRAYYDLFDYTLLLAYGYEQTADPLFLNVGRRVIGAMGTIDGPVCGSVQNVSQGYLSYSSWPAQMFIWLDTHRSNSGVTFLNDDPGTFGGLRVVNNGGGSYTLSWTVPAGASSYQIKYGPQIIVPNLNFDRSRRSYQYDPAKYDNFWAGNGGASCSVGSPNAGDTCTGDAECGSGGACIPAVDDQPRNVGTDPAPEGAGSTQTYTVTGLDPAQAYHFALRIYTTGPGAPAATPQPPSAPVLL